MVDAFLRQQGIWRAEDADGLVRASELYLKGWRARGLRLAVLTDSGASAVMMADGAARLGLALVEFPETIRVQLATILPAYASPLNPVDMTSVLRTDPELYGQVLDVVVDPDIADLFIIGFPSSGAGYDLARLARMTAERFSRCDLPVAVAIPQASIAQHYRALGVPTFSSETDALEALHQLALHSLLMNREAVIPGARCPIAVPGGDAQFLSEAQGLRFLAEQGLPVVEHTTCHTLETAHTAMRQLAATVVLKGSSSAVQHKTEHGLVCVDISTESELVHSFETIRARMKTMTVDSDGVIVARMICNAWEFMLGAHVDPVFGVVVLIGRGRTVCRGDPKYRRHGTAISD